MYTIFGNIKRGEIMITKKDIKRATLEQNTTAVEISERLGITPQNYNNLMDKNFRLNQQDLTRIANALELRYVSAFIDNNGNIVVGGVCDISELEEKTN